jgi:tetratricopeptide (TPR) repeat protein
LLIKAKQAICKRGTVMKALVTFFIIIAIALAGTSVWSATGQEKSLADTEKILAKIKKLELEQLEHPLNPDLQFILGSDYRILDNHDKAIEHYQRALRLDPNYDPALWSLSDIYNQKGDGAEAILHMKKAEAIFLEREDVKSLAKARKKLRGYFAKYQYEPEDFELPRGFFWRIFN